MASSTRRHHDPLRPRRSRRRRPGPAARSGRHALGHAVGQPPLDPAGRLAGHRRLIGMDQRNAGVPTLPSGHRLVGRLTADQLALLDPWASNGATCSACHRGVHPALLATAPERFAGAVCCSGRRDRTDAPLRGDVRRLGRARHPTTGSDPGTGRRSARTCGARGFLLGDRRADPRHPTPMLVSGNDEYTRPSSHGTSATWRPTPKWSNGGRTPTDRRVDRRVLDFFSRTRSDTTVARRRKDGRCMIRPRPWTGMTTIPASPSTRE